MRLALRCAALLGAGLALGGQLACHWLLPFSAVEDSAPPSERRGESGADGPRATDLIRSDFHREASPSPVVWSRWWDGPSASEGLAVALGTTKIYLGGTFESALGFPGYPLTSVGMADGFLARLDRSGTVEAAARLGSAQEDQVRSLALLPGAPDQLWAGGVLGDGYAIGAESHSGLFLFRVDAGTQVPNLAADLHAPPVMTLNPLPGVRGLATGGGAIHLAGTFAGQLSCGAINHNTLGDTDIVVASMLPTGACKWVQNLFTMPGPVPDEGTAVAVDSTGTVYAIGTIGLPTGKIALQKFGPAGNPAWLPLKTFDGAGADSGLAIVQDGSFLYVAGAFSGSVSFDGFPVMSAGGTDIFVARLRPGDGGAVWVAPYGGKGNDRAQALAIRSGRLYVGGIYADGATLGGIVAPAVGPEDSFVLCLDVSQSPPLPCGLQYFGGDGNHDRLSSVSADDTQVVVTGAISGKGVLPGAPPFATTGSSAAFVLSIPR